MRQSLADEPEDRALVEAAQRDRRRFGDLYERYFDRVYAYIAYRVRDRAETEDLTSDVFHRALANLARFEWRGAPFASWLFRIAANAIADRAERLERERKLEPAPESEDAVQEQALDLARVFELVRELPDEQRRVIEMRFAGQMGIAAIAAQLGRSEGAVKQLQFRGIQKLRERLGGGHG